MTGARMEGLGAALADRYRIERELGQGGMATVYLARDLKHDRPVALKVIRDDLASSMSEERFSREIRLAARLQHPHICPVYDSGETGDGQLWYTMPFLPGMSLRDRITREGRLSLAEAVRITREAAQALEFAHRQGVIHRDIKPENILLTEDGNTLVADFGIAKAAATDPGTVPTKLTETGIAIGTPAYMSPEQRLGVPVDARSDVYSLAATLYEMLLAELPPTAGGGLELFLAQMTDAAPRLSVKRKDITPALEQVVRKGISADPDQRFQSMAEFAAALEGALTGQYRAAGAGRRSWPRIAMIVAGLLIAIAGGVYRWNRSRLLSGPVTVAILPFAYPPADSALRDLTDGFSEDMRRILASLANTHMTSTETTRRIASGGRLTPVEVSRQLNAQVVVAPTVERQGDSITVSFTVDEPRRGLRGRRASVTGSEQFLVDHRDSLVAVVLAAIGRAPDPDILRAAASDVIRTRNPAVYRKYSNVAYRVLPAVYAYGQEGMNIKIRHLDSLLALDPDLLDAINFRAYVTFSKALTSLGRVSEAEIRQMLDEGRSFLRRAQAIDPDGPMTLRSNAAFLLASGDTTGSIAAFSRALALRPWSPAMAFDLCPLELARASRTAPLPGSCRSMLTIDSLNPGAIRSAGYFFQYARRFAEAEAAYRRCISLDPASVPCYGDLGDMLQMQGRLDESLAPLQQAVRLEPGNLQLHITLGYVLMGLERLDEAVEQLRKAASLPSEDRDFEHYLVDALVMAGRSAEAIDAGRATVGKVPRSPLAHRSLASALWAAGQFEAALKEIKTAIDLNPSGTDEWLQYAAANRILGRVAEAQRAVDRIMRIDPTSFSSREALVTQLEWIGQLGEALDQAEKRTDSTEARDLVLRAWMQLELNRSQDALASLARARQLDSATVDDHQVTEFIYALAGPPEAAIRAADHYRTLDPLNQFLIAMQIWVYARTGRRTEALAKLDSLEQRRTKVAASEVPLLLAYAGLGDTARAAAALSRSVARRDWDWIYLSLEDPRLDILRGSPEYQAAVRAFRQGGDR